MFALAAQIPDRSARASPADPFKNPSMDAGATPAEEPVTTSVPPPSCAMGLLGDEALESLTIEGSFTGTDPVS